MEAAILWHQGRAGLADFLGMAVQWLNTFEQLQARLDAMQVAKGVQFTTQGQAAVQVFLDLLENEGSTQDNSTGEIFGKSGRRVALPGFLNARKKDTRR